MKRIVHLCALAMLACLLLSACGSDSAAFANRKELSAAIDGTWVSYSEDAGEPYTPETFDPLYVMAEYLRDKTDYMVVEIDGNSFVTNYYSAEDEPVCVGSTTIRKFNGKQGFIVLATGQKYEVCRDASGAIYLALATYDASGNKLPSAEYLCRLS